MWEGLHVKNTMGFYKLLKKNWGTKTSSKSFVIYLFVTFVYHFHKLDEI